MCLKKFSLNNSVFMASINHAASVRAQIRHQFYMNSTFSYKFCYIKYGEKRYCVISGLKIF